MYGYIGLHTEIELDLPTTARAVNLVAQELKARALETPLLFSTHALDISTEGTHSLIRRFVHNQHEFPQGQPFLSRLTWLKDQQFRAPCSFSFFLI